MATRQELENALIAADAAGDTEAAQLFANEIKALFDGKPEIVYKPLPQDDPMQRQPNISKAKELLNWEPKVERKEGLKITLEYFKSLSKEDLYELDHKDFGSFNKF
jgi:dTDP-glucose 4,6-dehydratase